MSVFCHTHRVTYADCTVGNHVYYARYLDLLEAARGECFRQLGATMQEWQQREVIFPVIECGLRYKAAARYDDLLTIEVRLTAVKGARLNFSYRILGQNGLLMVEGETLHVCTGVTGKPKRLPDELRARLVPFLKPD